MENSSHRKIIFTRKSTVKVKIKDRVKFSVRVMVAVTVSVSYIMTIWRWEELSRCDKFPTTPVAAGFITEPGLEST